VCKKSGLKYFRDFKKKRVQGIEDREGRNNKKKLLKFTTEKHSRQNAHAR